MQDNPVVETVVDRLVELLTDLKYDDNWINTILEVADSDDRKQVIATLNHYIRVIENEI